MLSTLLSLPVASFIRSRHTEFLPQGSPLDTRALTALDGFFPRELLDGVRLVTNHEVSDPFVAKIVRRFQLGHVPSFRDVAAVTFSDVIVFHEAVSLPVLFHELVHVVQYQQLGIAVFARLYVRGFLRRRRYESIPLEKHAFDLGLRFAACPTAIFSVAAEVAGRIKDQQY